MLGVGVRASIEENLNYFRMVVRNGIIKSSLLGGERPIRAGAILRPEVF